MIKKTNHVRVELKRSSDTFSFMGGREEGIPWVWVMGGALVTVLLLIIALLGYVFSMGVMALWPRDIYSVQHVKRNTIDSQTQIETYMGIFQRRVLATVGSGADFENAVSSTEVVPEEADHLIYQANQDLSGKEFVYVTESEFAAATKPLEIWMIERLEWGPFIGELRELNLPGQDPVVLNEFSKETFQKAVRDAKQRAQEIEEFESSKIKPINLDLERLRIELKRQDRLSSERLNPNSSDLSNHFDDNGVEQDNWMKLKSEAEVLSQAYSDLSAELRKKQEIDAQYKVTVASADGTLSSFPVSRVVRAYQPNSLGIFEKVNIYFDKIFEFIFEQPREANTQGGIFPAIFGTVVMTLIMTVAVLPAGVMAAIYIREIAKQGFLVSIVRVAVGNLAGVPSIVFGIFGLGFFCYMLGGSIDTIFFRDKLPSPTFGTGGILWASLTLALLTLPVVVVSTEEALQSVPRSIREASYGCGATRLQTLLRVVIPRAMPGIMTGLILAMARGMGEVAPLLVTGVVKLAPQLPIDNQFPFFHLERSFMHLGFHIYDVGFQSRSAEVSRPMVFASTALLVGLVFVLNLVAIRVRSQLRKRYEGRGAF